MVEIYIPGVYKRIRRRFFYQCRHCWFQKCYGRLIQYAQERGLILCGEHFEDPENLGPWAAGEYLLIRELQDAMKVQRLRRGEIRNLIGASNGPISVAASKSLGIELTEEEEESWGS